jgi:negative regulator of flagellin synthesis FlgM
MRKEGNKQEKGEEAYNKDRVQNINLERWAGIAAEIKAEIEKLPDVRLDKIQEIKEAIDSGNYEIDSSKIAGRILSF